MYSNICCNRQRSTHMEAQIVFRCIPLSLRSKTQRRATLLLPTWIYLYWLGGTVSCVLSFTTNVTISTSISPTFHSWVAIFHFRPPMAFLSHSLCDMPGLAPLINDLFWRRCDFHISFSGRDMSRNVWTRLIGSLVVDMGVSSINMKFLSPRCYITFR